MNLIFYDLKIQRVFIQKEKDYSDYPLSTLVWYFIGK
jgi:hypothetical protein